MFRIPWLSYGFFAVALTAAVRGQSPAPASSVVGPPPKQTTAAIPIETLAPRQPLSTAAREAIARMKPIFDGQTLAGWIQAPPYGLRFGREDFRDLAALARQLKEKSDPVSAYLAGAFDEAGTKAISELAAGGDARAAAGPLVRNINRLISGGASLHTTERFAAVRLRSETAQLLAENPQSIGLVRLNRLLLEDAFPERIVRSEPAAWVVKDGAMASTGAGRGVIYTTADYSHFRLVFQVRQISGNHVPGILVFGTRPATRGDMAEAEAGNAALGAVQLQMPNGGHWDYRPGFNKAGEHFTRPIRVRFNLQEWAQVEVLVNARTGEARMAVAQPVGTQGIENLVFRDPAAGKAAPIAWQMHNAGLFDEFRDVRIEIDPKDHRLITVE